MKSTLTILFVTISLIIDAQWQQLNIVAQPRCLAIKDGTLLAGHTTGVFLSTNNGNNWSAFDNGISPQVYTADAVAINGTDMYRGGAIGGVYLSANIGPWVQINTGLPPNVKIKSFGFSGSNIYLGTDGHGMFLSSNNGANWSAINTGLTALTIKSILVTGTNIFIGTDGGGIFLSTNNGANWTAVNNGLPSITINSIINIGTNIFAAAGVGGIFKSIDNGASWTPINSGVDFINQPVYSLATSGTNIFASKQSPSYKTIFLSVNSGGNWSDVNWTPTYEVNSLATNSLYIFASETGAGIWRRQLSEVNGISEIDPNNSLISIYPNPSNGNISINSSQIITEIKISNLLGQQIVTLNPNSMNSTMQIESDGIYFVNITSINFSITKKIIINKP